MNFKTTDALFSKIKEDLYSFDAAGLLDEGKFHKDVQYVMAILGIIWYRDAEEMLHVDNYNVCLPKDFNLLESLYKCNHCGTSSITQPDGIVFTKLTFDHYPETQIPDQHIGQSCPSQTDYWLQNGNKIFNAFEQLLVQRGTEIHSYSHPTLMRTGNVNTKKSCVTNCSNIFSDSLDTFTIQNSRIYTNFKHGDMYLRYKAFPLDDDTGLPMIPDNIIVEKAMEDYIKYNILKNLRTNGDADVQNLLQLYKADLDVSLGKAISEAKTPSFNTMLHNVRLVRKRLNLYQLDNRYTHTGNN